MEENLKELEVVGNEINKEQEKFVLGEMSKIDGIYDYLKSRLTFYLKQYFVAQKENQEEVKGRYNVIMQLLISLQKIDNKE